jgi:hypothetical protein
MRIFRASLIVLTALSVSLPLVGHAFTSSGHKWKVNSVNYYINPANNDVPEADAITAIQKGAAVWADQSNANFAFYYMGRTTGNSFAANYKNEVFFRNTKNGSLVAEAYRWYNAAGDIIDSDIAFYDASQSFSTTAAATCSSKMLVENFAAHEFGHALGLSHSALTTATMYPSGKSCSTAWLSLDPDDLTGVETLYPPVTVNTVPTVSITSPSTGLSLTLGASTTFSGAASDKEDGSLSSKLAWTSNIDGAIGTGASFTKSLSTGIHVVTAKATDSAGATTTRSVTVTISAPLLTSPTIALATSGSISATGVRKVKLTWSGATGSKVDIYRNGSRIMTVDNDGMKSDSDGLLAGTTYSYKVCQRLSTVCSGLSSVGF